MKNFKEFAIPTVALFLICLVATTLLAVTNKVTAPKIAELSAQTEVETRQKVLPAATQFGETQEMKGGSGTYAVGKDASGNEAPHVLSPFPRADMRCEDNTGVDKNGAVTGISLGFELNETVGSRYCAQNASFLDQFKGKVKDIAVNKNSASGNEIQALTGATITSRAVTAAVNEALSYYDSNLKGAE